MDHHRLIQQEFSKQASRFEEKGLTLARQDYLQWMIDHLDVQATLHVLDVAAGTGHLSRAMAPKVERVVAVDATPAMLWQGRQEAERANLHNITFLQGFAEMLPFPDNAFAMVVCRFAIHHFEHPRIQIAEMVRVCRSPGTVAIIDLVSPDDEVLATRYNCLERLRDPSHTRALTTGELQQILQEAGLRIAQVKSRDIEVHVESWCDLTKTKPETRRIIREELFQEINGAGATGMRPFLRDKELMFLHTWTIVVGVKTGHA